MVLFSTQNENDKIGYLQNKRINNKTTKTKHATKLELKLTELTYTTENNFTDKRYCDAII